MEVKQIAVLMIEDDPGDARLIRRMLGQGKGNYALEWVDRLSAGVERIAQGGIDLVLLDLGLPESSGLDTLRRLLAKISRSVAVLVLSGHGDEEMGVSAVQEGAQDYLVKGEIDGRILARAIRYALERHEVEAALRKERAELERQVLERTAKLASTVESLERENAERKRAEQKLWEFSEMLRLVLDHMPAYVFWKDCKGAYLGCNRLFAVHAGLKSPEGIVGLTDQELSWSKAEAASYRANDQKVIESGRSELNFEQTQCAEGGSLTVVRCNKIPLRDPQGEVIGVLGMFEDITEQKRAEQLLSEAEAKYRCLVEESLVGIYFIQRGRFVYVNQQMAQIFGCTQEELLGMDIYSLVAPEDRERVMENVLKRESGQAQTMHYVFRGVRKDRQCIDLEVLGTRTVYNGRPAVIGSILDITERTRSEEALRRLNRELRAISNCNQLLMRARDEPSLLHDICSIVCEDADYRMAWVGFPEQDEAKTVRPVAWAGYEEGYLKTVKVSWGDGVSGQGPGGVAIREGRSDCIQDFGTDPRAVYWREEALRRGYQSNIALPLQDEKGAVFGAFSIYASQPNAFTSEEVRLLEELAGDLAFGIAVVRARQEREQALEKISHLAAIVECSNDAIFAKDLEGIIRSWNRGAERVYGYKAEEILGQSVAVLMLPEQKEELRTLLDQLKRGIQFENLEVQRVRKDGQLIDVSLTISPLRNSKGQIVGASIIGRDITGRKRAEQQLRALNEDLERRVADRTRELRLKTAFLEAQSNSTIDGILVIDPEGNKLFQNRRCVELFQIPWEISGQICDEDQFRWVAQQVRQPEQFIQRVLWLYSHPEEVGRDEVELNNGTILERYSAPVVDQEGIYYGRLWNFRDITERKQVQQKLEEALKKEIVLRREVHHRVKNNLQVIISLLYLQSTKVDDPAALALLRESQVRVHSIAIVHEMLYQREDLSRISFADYVRQLSADLFIAFRVSQRDVTLIISADEICLDLQTAIPCGIIVTELMTNALKYAFRPGTPGELRVSLEQVPFENKLVLVVQDDGAGLPKDLDTRRAQTLGLSLVRDLSKQLGGTVDYREPPCGHGTLIEIVFPDRSAAAPSARPKPEPIASR